MHSFDPDVAKRLGVNAAIIIANLAYLQTQREMQGGKEYYFEDRWWVRHTYESLSQWHSYLSVDQIRRIMKKLVKDNHIVMRHPKHFDRTTYWSVAPEFLHVAKSSDACGEIATSDVAKSPDVLHDNNIRTNNRFIPPTVDEVREYVTDKGYRIDPEAFVAHYQANGWYRGKSKVKCWKSCVTTWVKNSKPSTTKAYL